MSINSLDFVSQLHQAGDMVVSLLGLSTVGGVGVDSNGSSQCFYNCSLSSDCHNGSCICPCTDDNITYAAAFASFSYLLLLIATIQLVLVIVYGATQEDKNESSQWRKAFRITVQKCLLGAVIMATGTRAIYYTLITFIAPKWADILLNIYYPALLSAFSLLICFWAELFYHSSPVDGCYFLRKYKYSVTFLVFNVVVYLLLFADIVATPLVSEREQLQMSGIVSTIFAFLLFVTLIGFLHFAIRLFFRPDWQPFSIQFSVLKINLRQQAASICGVITNAFMQIVIIGLLVLNMVARFHYIDSHSLYVCAILIRVTELILPVWFCCSLWNYKQPKSLWILNPRLILKLDQNNEDVESKPILRSDTGTANSDYGAIQKEQHEAGLEVSTNSQVEGVCWVCQGTIEAPNDLFYPCNCRLHRNCIKQWVAKRASNTKISEKEYLRCQVCRGKYHIKRFTCVCVPKGLETKHWVQLFAVLFIGGVSVAGCIYAGGYSTLNRTAKIATVSCVVVFNAVLLKLLGCGMILAWRRSKYKTIDIKGVSVTSWREGSKALERKRARQERLSSRAELANSYSGLSESVQYSHSTHTVTGVREDGGEGRRHLNPTQT